MSALRVLWHLLRADFLERVRRYSFLVTLAATVWLGWLVGTGKLGIWIGEARGVFNSAWIGTTMAMVINTFLSLAGFYVVKGSVDRDRQTGVGQILATTPISKPLYTLGKAASNFAVLAAMVAVLAAAAVVIQLTAAEDSHLRLGTLLLPFILLALPMMALGGAAAVVFETIPFLRRGFGNVVWFFAWTGLMVIGIPNKDARSEGFPDAFGLGVVFRSMTAAFRHTYGKEPNGFILGGVEHSTKTGRFIWEGMDWTAATLTGRFVWTLVALAVAFLAALFFDRFDPSRGRSGQRKAAKDANGAAIENAQPAPAAVPHVSLTPLSAGAAGAARFRFAAVLIAELKLALKGTRWWWWAGAAGTFIATLAAPLPAVKEIALPLAWIWPILIWSPLGTRESRFDTGGLLFSAPRPLLRQLPATWAAGVVLAMLTGCGAAIHFLAKGDLAALGAWLVGALFIPTFALALGVWSGTGKLFEILYLVVWYIGPMNHVPAMDYLGSTKASMAQGMPLVYLAVTALLAAAAVAGRRWRLQAG
ncbi:MAG TPA: ABC transporter permease [Thermoanaerobaculia bacterium]